MTNRPKNRETEYEDLTPGAPPRPRSEPPGAEGTSASDKTRTDPSTGETQRPANAPNESAAEENPPAAHPDRRIKPET